MMSSETETDDEYSDDPIKLIDFEQGRMNSIEERLNDNTSEALPYDLTDSDVDVVSDHAACTKSKGVCLNLPVAFFQISRNIELLNGCRPLSIKVVDCDKHYWYYNKHSKRTDDSDVIVVDDDINVESVENLSESNIQNNNDCMFVSDTEKDKNMSLGAQPVKPKIRPVDISSYIKNNRTNASNTFKHDTKSLKTCVESIKQKVIGQQRSQIDLKKNKGLVGLKIVQKHTVATTKDDKEYKEKRKGKLKDVDVKTNERNLDVSTYMNVTGNVTKVYQDDSSEKSVLKKNLKSQNFNNIFVNNVKNKKSLLKSNTNSDNTHQEARNLSEITEEFKPSTKNDIQMNNTHKLQSNIHDKNETQVQVKSRQLVSKYFTDEVWDTSLRMAIQPNSWQKFCGEGKESNSWQQVKEKLKKKKKLNENKNCDKNARFDRKAEQIDNNSLTKEEMNKSIEEMKKSTNRKENISSGVGKIVPKSSVFSSDANKNGVALTNTMSDSVAKPLGALKSRNENNSPCKAKTIGNLNEEPSILGFKVKPGKKQKLSKGKATSMKINKNSKKNSAKNTCKDRSLPVIEMAPLLEIKEVRNNELNKNNNETVNIASNTVQNQLNPAVIHTDKQIPSNPSINYQSNQGMTITNKSITLKSKTANNQLNPGVMYIDKPMTFKPTFAPKHNTQPYPDVMHTDKAITSLSTAINKQSNSSLSHSNKPITSNPSINPQITDLNRNILTMQKLNLDANVTKIVTNRNKLSKNALQPDINMTKPVKRRYYKPRAPAQPCNKKVKNNLGYDTASMGNGQINSDPTGINTASAPVNYQQIPHQQNNNLQQIPHLHSNNVQQIPYQQSNNYIKPPAHTLVSNTDINADKTYDINRSNQMLLLYNDSYLNPSDNITTAVPTTQAFVTNVNPETSVNENLIRSSNFTPCHLPVPKSQVAPQRQAFVSNVNPETSIYENLIKSSNFTPCHTPVPNNQVPPQRTICQADNNDTRFIKDYVTTSSQQIDPNIPMLPKPKADGTQMNRNSINYPSETNNLNKHTPYRGQVHVQGKPIQAFVTNRQDFQKFNMSFGPHRNFKRTGRNNIPHQMTNPFNFSSPRPIPVHGAPIYDNPQQNMPYVYPDLHNFNQNGHWCYGPPPPPPPPPPFEQQCTNVPIQQQIYFPPTLSSNAPPTSPAGSTIIGRNNDGLVRKITLLAAPTQEQPKPTMAESNIKDTTPVNSKMEMLQELSKITILGHQKEKDLETSIFKSPTKKSMKRTLLKDEDPREMTSIQKPEIGPLSKKFNNPMLASKSESEGNTPMPDNRTLLPHKGYSPAILPIATFEKTFEILAQANVELFDKEEVKPITEEYKPISNKINESDRKRRPEFRDQEKNTKKISIHEYKKRSKVDDYAVQSSDKVDIKSECKSLPDQLPDLKGQITDQDLGYDSDSTMKL